MDLDAPVKAAQASNTGRQNLIGGFQNQSNDLYSRYKNAIDTQGTTGQAAEQIGNNLGLPALRQNAFQLNQAVQRAPQVAQDVTRGFDVNNSQLQNVISNKLAKLSPLAQQATAQQQNAENSLNTQLGYTQNDWSRQLQPIQLEASQAPGMQALKLSGYDTGAAEELSALFAKQNAGITLSEGDKNRASQLALAEQQHKFSQQDLTAQNAYNASLPNYQSVSAGDSLYDPRTGKFITAPASKTTDPSAAAARGTTALNQNSTQKQPALSPTPSFKPKP